MDIKIQHIKLNQSILFMLANIAFDYKEEDNKKYQNINNPKNPFMILVVDDNKHFIDAISYKLKKITDVQVESCLTGTEAVKMVYKQYYDLVLLDIKFEKSVIDGIEVFNKMKKLRPYLNIVFVSAFTQEERGKEAAKLPALAYFEKPFDFRKLEGIINTIKQGKQ